MLKYIYAPLWVIFIMAVVSLTDTTIGAMIRNNPVITSTLSTLLTGLGLQKLENLLF